jgi:AcrR family transcriptional regulator
MQDRSRKTRQLVLEAAYRVFVREGFERAQLDTIAQEAGRTKGAVYTHFESKEHLFLSLLERRTLETAHRVDELVAGASDPEHFIEVLRNAVTELRNPDWAILNLELKLYAIRHPSASERLRKAYRQVHKSDAGDGIFELLKQRGESRISHKLSALWTIVSAIVLDMNFDPEMMTRREARLVLSEVFDGLFSRKSKTVRKKAADHKDSSTSSARKPGRRAARP